MSVLSNLWNVKYGVLTMAVLAGVGLAGEAVAEVKINPYPQGVVPMRASQGAISGSAAVAPPQNIRQPMALPPARQAPPPPLPQNYEPQAGAYSGYSSGPPTAATPRRYTAPGAVHASPSAQNWSAFAGANVRDTLGVWSQNAGVELIWMGQHSEFDVLETVTVGTTYEAAVQALLEQYQDKHVRPVGSLHIDPRTGSRTLVIEIGEGV